MFIRILLIISLILGNGFFNKVQAQDENSSQPIPGRYIIKFKDSNGTASEKASGLEKKHGLKAEHIYNNGFKGANVIVPPGKEKDLANDPDVEKVIQDFTVYALDRDNNNDDSHSQLPEAFAMSFGSMTSGTSNAKQIIPTGIKWVGADLNTTNEGTGVKVAVLDTGISFSHPDLMVNIPLSRDFSGDGTSGNDNNTSNGVGGHGTHVAGVIAALNNTIGVLGVGSSIDLVSVKVLSRTGSGSFGSIIAGLDYVTANANLIGVANLSLGATGGTNPSQSFIDVSNLLRQAVQRAVNAGVIVVVAAGNSAVDVTAYNAVPAMYPEVFSVSAVDDRDGVQGNDTWAYFSNYGTEVDIIAPGVNILSTAIGGGTSSLSGTSFSSPHVAGTIGLYIARNGRPTSGDERLLGSILSAISKPRTTLLPGEPGDGVIEPSCYANGPSLQ